YTICRNLINSYDSIPTEYLFLLRDALLMVPIVEYERKKFHLSEVAFNQLHHIMEETQDYQKKPILRMLEGQYLYVVKNDIFEAKKAYQEGIILARLLGDTSLTDIISEKMRDAMKE
ncbi:MAG: XRE family transcriptional regulator, partial [Streptococcus salivarius]